MIRTLLCSAADKPPSIIFLVLSRGHQTQACILMLTGVYCEQRIPRTLIEPTRDHINHPHVL